MRCNNDGGRNQSQENRDLGEGELMEAVCQATDEQEKLILTAWEYRARLVRELWKEQGQN